MLTLVLTLLIGGSPLPPDVKPWPIGVGPGYRLRAAPTTVLAGRPVGRLRCEENRARRFGAHLELFARRQVVIVPAGVGVARPFRVPFNRIVPGRCTYPLRTLDPRCDRSA
jgi:hypothetical protein